MPREMWARFSFAALGRLCVELCLRRIGIADCVGVPVAVSYMTRLSYFSLSRMTVLNHSSLSYMAVTLLWLP